MPDTRWIFDAVSIGNFFLSGGEELLLRRYSRRMVISWQVYDELTAGAIRFPALRKIQALVTHKRLPVVTLTSGEHAEYSHWIRRLGKGESACLAVAHARSWTVVTDDKAARQECASAGIAVTGTIGILVAACRDRQVRVEEADALLCGMIEAGFYSPVASISKIL